MLKKLPFIIPLLALTALLLWWFTPHYTEEDEAYYRAVFCVIDHDDSRQFLDDMQNIVEGGILTTRCIKRITCRRWGSGCWTPGISSARRNSRRCVRTGSAAARYYGQNSRVNNPGGLAKQQPVPASDKIPLLMSRSLSQNPPLSPSHGMTFFSAVAYDKK